MFDLSTHHEGVSRFGCCFIPTIFKGGPLENVSYISGGPPPFLMVKGVGMLLYVGCLPIIMAEPLCRHGWLDGGEPPRTTIRMVHGPCHAPAVPGCKVRYSSPITNKSLDEHLYRSLVLGGSRSNLQRRKTCPSHVRTPQRVDPQRVSDSKATPMEPLSSVCRFKSKTCRFKSVDVAVSLAVLSEQAAAAW